MIKERRGIQSIEVGGQLLNALVKSGTPMMLKDLASEAGMPPAKAHPYLVSFAKLGLIEQNPATARYELGPLALELGLDVRRDRHHILLVARSLTDSAISLAAFFSSPFL